MQHETNYNSSYPCLASQSFFDSEVCRPLSLNMKTTIDPCHSTKHNSTTW